MHILLTDRLACPRCGPEFGLILLANEVRDRRVLEGDLGCPNCREIYPIRGGFGDLRPPPRAPIPPLEAAGEEGGPWLGAGPEVSGGQPDEALRLGALLGVTEGPGMLLLKGPVARLGKALADLIGQIEVVVMDPALRDADEEEGVSRLTGQGRIPFYSGSFRGVALSGDPRGMDLEEACRVVAPLSRLVVLGAGPEMAGRVRALGLSILLEQDGVLAAGRDGPAVSPLIPLRGPQGPPTLP